jgi:hypothetical protein
MATTRREQQLEQARQMARGLRTQVTPSNSSTTPKSAGGFANNLLKSGGNFLKNTALGVANIFNPDSERNTVANVARVAVGGLEKLVPGQQDNEDNFDAVVDFFKSRYGTKEAAFNTAYEDPVGFASDLSVVLGGVGAVAKAGNLNKVASVATKASKAIDPFNAASKAVSGAGKAAREALGATTGAGSAAVREAFEAGAEGGSRQSAFKSTLRAPGTGEDILGTANSALDDLFEQRRTTYQDNLLKLEQDTYITKNGQLYVRKELKGAEAQVKGYEPGTEVLVPTQLTTKGVKDIATRAFKDIGIDAKNGTIDFSKRPSLDATNLQKLSDLVYDWEDLTPTGLNQLRQEIEGFRKGGINLSPAENRFNVVVDKMSAGLTKYLEDRVPAVKPLNAEYAKQTEFIKEIRRELSLGDGKSIDTGIRKLTSVMRQNNEFRLQLIEQLQATAGRDITARIAGAAMNPYLPRGMAKPLITSGAVLGSVTFGVVIQALPALLLASPRIVAEFINALGVGARQIEKTGATKAAGPAARTGFQVERSGANDLEQSVGQ